MSHSEIAARLAAARKDLEERMAAAGLSRDRGWDILEQVEEDLGGSVWILVPIHPKRQSPEGLRATVSIDREGNVRG